MTLETFKNEVIPLKNKLYRFALRFINDTMEAQDVVQDVFLKLWSKRNSLERYRSVEALAMVMTKNQCLDILKSKAYKMKTEMNSELNYGKDSPEDNMERKETVKRVKEFIDALPEQQKIVIHLRDIEGYEFEEIAEITQMNLNAVRVNLSRARKKVRELLQKNNMYEFTTN